jgi:hypothetical protein
MHMTYTLAKQKLRAVGKNREWLIQSLREHLLPVLVKRGFEVRPLVQRGPVDREFVESFPLGRLIRARELGIDLIEIQFAPYRRAAFRMNVGVAPKEGIMTFTGHWRAEDVAVHWLNESFDMYAFPRWRIWFSVWRWPGRSATQAEFDKLALRVASYIPELELALREGRLGPHMRRLLIERPTPSEMC